MKKAVVASLLAVASMTVVSGSARAAVLVDAGLNQQAPAAGGGQGVQMSPAEYKAYNDAEAQTAPAAKASALDAYLTAYPQSAVKGAVLEQIMGAYSMVPDVAKSIDAADRLIQVDPNNIRAYLIETYFRKQQAVSQTDATARQAGLDKAAEFATKGLAVTKPAAMSDDDFKKLKDGADPVFYSAIGTAAFNKKDTATAITNFKQELAIVPPAATQTPGDTLQDVFWLAEAYMQSTPPDFLNCAFYAARVAAYVPDNLKPNYEPTAKYCYKKYHGKDDGYDTLVTTAKANLNPPAGFTVAPAPSPADIANQVVSSTSDLSTLAVSDKEFILANGKPEDAAKVWDTVKGKSVQFPDTTVIAVTDTTLQVAVSDDAVQTKAADFTFQLKEPLKTPPAVGAKVTVTGTYASYTPSPIMITMSDGAVVEKKAPAAHAPVHHTAAHH